MTDSPIVIIGAGAGGLSAAIALATRGLPVILYERQPRAGGKIHTAEIDGRRMDAGPTVFTMRDVFEEIFAEAGESFADAVAPVPLETLARHAWDDKARLDLFADRERSADAIAAFAGPAEGKRYLRFCEQTRKTYETLNHTFIRASKPNPISLTQRTVAQGLGGIRHIQPFANLWDALGRQFHDQRLRQLFGRYATYCGSSPYQAPATLMLVAHVEQEGVWRLAGGMAGLATALQALAGRVGVDLRLGCGVDEIRVRGRRVVGVRDSNGNETACAAVISNADPAALPAGVFGEAARAALKPVPASQRSLSALTWSQMAHVEGFPLHYHSVFFSRDYRREFDDIFQRGRLPAEPTVYVCAQDRIDGQPPGGPERIFCLANAPAIGDRHTFTDEEIQTCVTAIRATLARCGLALRSEPDETVTTTPNRFEQWFPATGGALYGQASHGWKASFSRPGSRTAIRGLYLAGGATHPGPGVPMAALSGRLAAQALLADRASTARSSTVAMPGGTSTQ